LAFLSYRTLFLHVDFIVVLLTACVLQINDDYYYSYFSSPLISERSLSESVGFVVQISTTAQHIVHVATTARALIQATAATRVPVHQVTMALTVN